MIDQIKRLQESLVELGVARNILAIAAPKTLLIEDQTSKGIDGTAIFAAAITEREIVEVSRDLFASGYYNLAVSEALKALDKYVASRTGSGLSGTQLMRQAFRAKSPRLSLSSGMSQSERDEQEGYEHIFAGTMLGIRNPTTHEFDWIDEKDTALELLMLTQHLLRKAKSATVEDGS